MNSNGLKGHPCFAPLRHNILPVVPLAVDIFVEALLYVSWIMLMSVSGMPLCFNVDVMREGAT